MLKIVQITSNPKRKRISKKKRARNYRRAKIIRTEIKAGYKPKVAEAIAYRKVPEKKRRKVKRKRKIIRVRKNPPRKTYQTIITGLVKTREKRFKTYYFTGKSFVRNKEEAKIYPGSLGKVEAKRILNLLPPQIESLSVERV